jgi:hypothetical protein
MSFYKSTRNELDPLDNEILERAFDASWDAIKSAGQHFDAESDEELEAALRRELSRDAERHLAVIAHTAKSASRIKLSMRQR